MRNPFRAPLVLLMTFFLMASGCTRVGLAYRHLDVIIPWSLNDYLDMSSAQKSWLDERLNEHLNWHCTTQLPGYLAWLDRLQQMVETNHVTETELNARTAEAKQAIETIAERITPSTVELLSQLDDRQVQAMQAAFAKDLRERKDKLLKPPLDQQISDRARRMEKRLSPWIGTLNPTQRQRVLSWSSSLGEQNRMRIDNRAHWQALFIDAVQQRQSSEFPQRIAQLLQKRDSFWTPEYRQAYDLAEHATTRLLADVMAESTPEQRQHLLHKIAEIRKDFSGLGCLQAGQQS